MEREREKVVEEEDRDKMDGDIRASATDQDEPMADEVGQPDKVNNALKILVHNAIEEFGVAPRDVYNGIFNLPRTRDEHAVPKNLNYSKLLAIVKAFSVNHELLESSDEVVCVYPRESQDYHDHYDEWEINFKSIRIAEEVMQLMRSEEDQHLRRAYHILKGFRTVPL